jgi:hypothetical protein
MNQAEIEQKIKDMLDRNNIKIVDMGFLNRLWNWYVKPFFDRIKYFIQEIVWGYNETDPWNVAWYIARKILPPLKKMRNNFHGTSIRLHKIEKDGTVSELTDVIFGPDTESLTEQEWRSVLDDIIFAFEYQLKEDADKKSRKRQKRGLKLFAIYYNNLWD